MNTDTTESTGAPDYLGLARDAFATSTTYFDSSIRPAMEASIRQFQGVHPTGSKYHSDAYKSRSRLFRPKTRTTIRKNEAVAAEAFFSTADTVTVTPEDDDDPKQRAAAEINHYLLNYRLKKSIPWFLLVCAAYQETQSVGVACSYQYWKYDAKKKIDKPCVDLVPPENLRVAPGCDWTDPINSSPYVIHMIPMLVKDVRARMTNPDPTTGQTRWIKLTEEQILAAQTSSSDSTRQVRERGRTDSTDQRGAINAFATVWVHRNIIEIDGEDMIFYTLGTSQMLSKPIPLQQAYWHGRRPYVMGICVIEAHKAYPDGVAGITKDTQTEINEVANQRIDNVKFAMNKRYFAARGRQVDLRSLTRNVPGSVTMMTDIEKDVKVVETNDVTRSAYEEQDRLNLDFDDVAGAFSPSSLQSNRKLNETVGGINTLTSNANQVGSYQLRTFVETWVQPVLQQLTWLEREYETDQVILTLAQKASKMMQQFQGEAGTDGFIDELLQLEMSINVNVGVGSTNPADQIAAFMDAMAQLKTLLEDQTLERYGLDVAEVIKLLFGKLGYRDGDRFFNIENEDPRLTNAKAMVQQLQQQLQQKVSPEMVAKQMEKIDAEITKLNATVFDINSKALFANMQTAQMVEAVPQLAPVADGISADAGFQRHGGEAPGFPVPQAPAPGLTQNSVKDPRTGIEFTPGGAVAGDTSPLTPAGPAMPASPEVGANKGIETVRADS